MDCGASTHWQAIDEAVLATVPPALRSWLALTTSMTRELETRLQSAIRVALLRSDPGHLYPDEERCFERTGAAAHVREVCLHGAGRPVLAARTVHVSPQLANDPALAFLGQRPLGELLFGGPTPAPWTLREVARLDEGSPLHALVARCLPEPPPCWARRTLFWRGQQPLLVTEIFLPPVPA